MPKSGGRAILKASKQDVMNHEVLNSWKEIAVYLGRGIRTVQRWERELQLPIRRPRKNARTAVMAFRGELDEWLSRVPVTEFWRETADPTVQLPFLAGC